MISSQPKTLADLRKFGFAFGGGLTVLGSLLWWRDKVPAPYVLTAAAIMLLLAAVAPRLLKPFEWFMAGLFRTVTMVLTYVVLTIVFLFVLTPIGLVRRVLGKESLGLRPDPSQKSYWVDVEEDGPGSRPKKPF